MYSAAALKGGVRAYRYADFRFALKDEDKTSSHPDLWSCLKGNAGVYPHPGRESAFPDSDNNYIRTLLYVSSRCHGLTPPYGTKYRSALTPPSGAMCCYALTPPFKAEVCRTQYEPGFSP